MIDPAMAAVPGAAAADAYGDPGVELAGAWDQRGRLWALATSRYGYVQLGYWTGAGRMHVYPPMAGSPVAISAPGSG